MTRTISSAQNPIFKRLLALTKPRGIRRHALALLSGPRQVTEAVRDFPERCAGMIHEEKARLPEIPADAAFPVYRLSPALFHRLDLHGTRNPLVVVRAGPFPPWAASPWPVGCTLFVPFQDPANVGAVIRSAAAFGVARIVMLAEAAHPFHPKSARAAGSHLLRVPIQQGPALDALRIQDVPCFRLDPAGHPVHEAAFPRSFALLPGLEGPGLPEHLKGQGSLSIPMEAGVDSLNAATAVGIALYAWRRQTPLM